MADKKLPHNTEAEKAVLGAMIRSEGKVSEAVAKLSEDDFFEENENHRAIFAAIFRLYNRSEHVDPQTITNELIVSKQLEVAGGPEYLVELADSDILGSNFDDYVKIVSEQATLRRFIVELDAISKEAFNKDIGSISDFLALSEKKITDITSSRKVGDFVRADEVTKELSVKLAELKTSTSDDMTTGTPTGFPKLNILTHGFQPGEFIVLAARPAVGKTALALNLMYNATTKANVPVAYFSLEMPASMLFKRLISADADVEFNSLITGFDLTQNKRLKIQQSCERMSTKKIYVDDTAGIKLLDLVAKCKKLKAKEPNLGLIIVDYIGLVTTNTKTKSESRQLEVQMVSQTLKKLALDLQVPVIGVAQLNRNVEQRNGGEPQLSDLRESGSIEQDADIVMMLQETKVTTGEGQNQLDKHNNEVEQAKQKVVNADGKDIKLVTLYVRKNRSGRTGDVPLLFKRSFCRFDSLSEEATRKVDDLNSERTSYLPRGE